MKIRPEHYQYMQQAIENRLATYSPQSIEAYLLNIQADPRVKDWRKRYRWDLAHAAGLTPWFCAVLYSYLNDTHIDTALRHIMQERESRHVV